VGENPERLEGVTTLQMLADRVAQGDLLNEPDIPLLLESRDLIAIGMMADDVRRQQHGVETTFVRVLEIHVDAVPSSLPQGVSAGEFRLVGAPSSLDAACAAVAQAKRLAGGTPVTGFSLSDLAALESSGGYVFGRLRDAGLDAVADTPVDRTPVTTVQAARTAGLSLHRLTVHAPPQSALDLIHAARMLQASAGGFRAFAPLPRTMSVTTPTTGYDDVKLVALARLLIREIPSIQVDWPLYGPKLAQVVLTVGADDVDGIAAVETGTLGTRRSAIAEIEGNIRAAGLQPIERDGRFAIRGRQ
jgi:aminodeoxyfutalosine synthase